MKNNHINVWGNSDDGGKSFRDTHGDVITLLRQKNEQ